MSMERGDEEALKNGGCDGEWKSEEDAPDKVKWKYRTKVTDPK